MVQCEEQKIRGLLGEYEEDRESVAVMRGMFYAYLLWRKYDRRHPRRVSKGK